MAKRERAPRGGAGQSPSGPAWKLEDLNFQPDGHLLIRHPGLADAIERAMEKGKASPTGKKRLWMDRLKPVPKREVTDQGKSGGTSGTTAQGHVVVNMMCPCTGP